LTDNDVGIVIYFSVLKTKIMIVFVCFQTVASFFTTGATTNMAGSWSEKWKKVDMGRTVCATPRYKLRSIKSLEQGFIHKKKMHARQENTSHGYNSMCRRVQTFLFYLNLASHMTDQPH
jgi:hypothetical protein